MMKQKYPYPASLACQVRSSIRFKNALPYQTFVDIFKGNIKYNEYEHRKYFLAFFEECYPSLIKDFMAEQNITRKEILSVFCLLPQWGETASFREALVNGKF